MNRETLPITSILVEDRFRVDLGDIDSLADSIARLGLIQPIVITQDNRLIAGGRRLAAHIKLGLPTIEVVRRETLTTDELHEMELEENVRRKDMSWQERCLLVAQIHNLKKQRGALAGTSWGVRETGELLGVGKSQVGYTLTIAEMLKSSPDHPAWKCNSMADAWRDCVMKSKIEEAEAELARRQAELTALVQDGISSGAFTQVTPSDDVGIIEAPVALNSKEDARQRYLANPMNDPAGFESYWLERNTQPQKIVYLTPRFHLGDSIDFMNGRPDAFDHIITDIPYGIDMTMLNQSNPNGSLSDLADVIDAHDVDYNLDLIAKFFPAAYYCTKAQAFVATWCDISLWQYMFDLATKAGFVVQKWPIIWNKTHRCMNQCTMYNTTKDFEIAMICRKPGTSIANQPDTSRLTADNTEMRKLIGHPFAKPRECWQFLVEALTIEGQLILDPFVGRGSMPISTLPLNRRVMGVELETNHYNALLENLKRYYLAIDPEYGFI